MRKIKESLLLVIIASILLSLTCVQSPDMQAKETGKAYKFLNQGKWYSWGEVPVLSSDTESGSHPRAYIKFTKKYLKEYTADLDTGEYNFDRKLKYKARMKNGKCIVKVIGEDRKYIGYGDVLHCYFKHDGKWTYSGTDSLTCSLKSGSP